MIALAMDIRCFSPPEREAPFSTIMVSYPSGRAVMKSWQQAFFAAAITSSIGASGFPKRILLAIVSWNKNTF